MRLNVQLRIFEFLRLEHCSWKFLRADRPVFSAKHIDIKFSLAACKVHVANFTKDWPFCPSLIMDSNYRPHATWKLILLFSVRKTRHFAFCSVSNHHMGVSSLQLLCCMQLSQGELSHPAAFFFFFSDISIFSSFVTKYRASVRLFFFLLFHYLVYFSGKVKTIFLLNLHPPTYPFGSRPSSSYLSLR